MAYVASSLLYGAEIADASSHVVYTVPLQRRTIVKTVNVRSLITSASHVSISFKDSGITYTGAFFIYTAAAGSQGDCVFQELWAVLNPGTTITVQWAAAAGGFVMISGAELEL